MYSKTEELSTPQIEEVIVSNKTQIEIDLIKKKTRSQLELLKTQTERLKLFDANIDIDFAIKWYEIRSSQFSKLAYFYGQKGWFDRQVLHGEVVAGAIVLGLAVHALAFFAVVGAYYKLSEILSDHYNVEEANKEAIRKSFEGLREELRQSIETFNEMERKLDEAFTALEEQTVSLSTTIAQLSIEAGKLHIQVARLEAMVKQLQEQQQKMLATTSKLSDVGEKLSQEIESLSGIITEKKIALDFVSIAIESAITETIETRKLTTLSLTQVKEEVRTVTLQEEKCQRLLYMADNSILGSKKAAALLDESIESCILNESDDDDVILKAQQALTKASSAKASRTEGKEFDYTSPPLR